MAKKDFQNTSSNSSNTYYKGMLKDNDDAFYPQGAWSHAVNGVNNTSDGDTGTIANEQGNIFCARAPYPIIGRIYLFADKWIIFSTDQINSEIGLFDEALCSYCTVVNDQCLQFSKFNLITGASKQNFDCTWQIYWADGLNPDRAMNIGDPNFWTCTAGQAWPGVPYIQECTIEQGYDPNTGEGCEICTNIEPLQLDCSKIRLSQLVESPCIQVSKGASGGNMPNGSYYAVIAYSINGQRVTDYSTPSNIQPIFSHQNLAGSLTITISDIDTEFYEEFELVIVSTISQQTVAKQVGFYSTNTGSITLDSIDLTTPTIPLELIPQISPVYETSEEISTVNNYLLRTAPTSRLDFNYQPLANKIQANWVAVEYPPDYYKKGGSNTSYLRDEVYAFWIRFVYETGEKSSSYHIPGRPPQDELFASCIPPGYGDVDPYTATADNIEQYELPAPNNYIPKFFEVYNTAYMPAPIAPIPLADGGVIVARGKMGYWQSTEKYANKPEIWNSSMHPWSDINCTLIPDVDLCGEYIRHHKMPDNKCVPHIKSYDTTTNNGYTDVEKIVVLGVEFDNIRYPVDNDGIGIPGVVGYEILRGAREGNKSIIAKGMFNNMREYDIDRDGNPRKGLYQNYPYNPVGDDPTLILEEAYPGEDICTDPYTHYDLPRVKTDTFTFHSPDTTFREPFLAETEVKMYGEIFGNVYGNFDTVPGHPKHKVISDMSMILAALAGVGIAAIAMSGNRKIRRSSGYAFNLGNIDFGNVSTDTTGIGFTLAGPYIGGSVTQTGSISNNMNGSAEVPEDNGSSQETMTTDHTTDSNTFESNQVNYVNSLFGFPIIPTAGVNNIYTDLSNDYNNNAQGTKGYIGPGYTMELENSPFQFGNSILGAFVGAVAKFSYYWAQGADSVIKLIEALVSYEQYALMYTSRGNYSQYDPGLICTPGNQRRYINKLFYLDNNIQNFKKEATNQDFTINNLYRNKCVVIDLNNSILPFSAIQNLNTPHSTVGTCLYSPTVGTIQTDNTLQSLHTVSLQLANENQQPADVNGKPVGPGSGLASGEYWYINPSTQFRTNALSLYGAIKYRNRNQYGQLELVRQIPATRCVLDIEPLTQSQLNNLCTNPAIYSSGLIFGGDTYIGRYTEKNKFFYFQDWLMDLPDGTPLDYTLKYMIQNPRFWGDFTGFDLGTFINSLVTLGFLNPATQTLPNDFHSFDRWCPADDGFFNVMHSYFYLFQCGVRDFFVESEINIDLRDWGDLPEQRHYAEYEYTDLNALFDPSIIKRDNYYKYDYSLSVSRIFNNFISWGAMHPRYYDPLIAERCYTAYPRRLLYSLPAQTEQIKDNWYAFLANNYKDFTSPITSVKSIGKNGAAIFFERESPVMFQGVDTLETDLGTKITIGDGGLFSQPMQNVVNSDAPYQYGSCQDSMSIVNTPAGLYYISQNQGKVFQLTQGLVPISDQGMKWWFNAFLPFQLLVDFPDFELTDNPVAGIGCQSIYNNKDVMIYFCKKDYKLRPEYQGILTYAGQDSFMIGQARVTLGDPTYFYDASWTLSYDPKANEANGSWISFHDWHPNHNIPSKNYFLTILNDAPWFTNANQRNGMWKHNLRTDVFTNYYDHNFRFEVEFPANTSPIVNSMRNVMYQMECYTYEQIRKIDRYNVLDFNFDHAIVHNIEQVSGILNLVLHPKNDVFTSNLYPIINPASIDILYTKEEQKYRFNQFWDITADRGEYTYPTVQRTIWETQPNGYDMNLNPNNLDYNKNPFEHKKFRHYTNFVKLYTRVDQNIVQNVNMLLKFSSISELYSPR